MLIADSLNAMDLYVSCDPTKGLILSVLETNYKSHYPWWITVKYNCDWLDFKMEIPEASHMGGACEHQICSVQNVLASLLAQHAAQLDDEALRTFESEAEAII